MRAACLRRPPASTQVSAAFTRTKRRAELTQSDLATIYNNLGILQTETGQQQAALNSYDQARHLQEQLVATHPEDPIYQQQLARTYNNLGPLQQHQG